MRIALLPLSYLPLIGGAEFVVHNVALEHREAGHEVAVFPNFRSIGLVGSLPYPCVPMWRRSWSRTIARSGDSDRALANWSLRWRLQAIQRVFRPDVWHVHAVYPVAWAVVDVLREALGVPVVVTSHGSDIFDHEKVVSEGDEQVDQLVARRIRSTLASADARIAVGPKVFEAYKEAGAPVDGTWLIGHGWHRERVEAARLRRYEVRDVLGVNGRFMALTVASDRSVKRLDDVLASVRLLGPESDVVWVVATSGDRISEEVDRLDLHGQVMVRNARPMTRADAAHGLPEQEILELFAACDVMVLPSVTETSPTVVHEAFTAGRPVIATTAAGAGLVQDGEDGLLVDPSRPDALAAAVRRLRDDRGLLSHLTAGAERHGSTLDDWSAIAAAHRQVYESVIRR